MENQPIEKKNTRANELYEWVEMLGLALVVVVFVFTFLLRVVTISGPSMTPTLLDGQRVIVSNFLYEPKGGDVVVFTLREQSEPFIKRIIATDGQTVDFDPDTARLIVDGQPLDEPYINEVMNDSHLWYNESYFPVTVGEDQYFACGDNRNHSWDSRYQAVGGVDREEIVGRALLVLFPFSDFGLV